MALRRILIACLVASLPACGQDPVHSHLVDSLGGEAPGVPEGPLHRPGQPCVACHGHLGPADTIFSLAGTIYQDATMTSKVLPDATVHFEDLNGKTYDTAVNCAGNFFVMDDDYHPAWPVWVTIGYGFFGGMQFTHPMTSPVYREASCAMCHVDNGNTSNISDTVPHVYLSDQPLPVPPNSP
jgi:hypothetical protein